ncbi:unnamed protein product [Calicophoron daubneyi]|uniref:DUF3421 domain-containing protein n=1 Tax=Calicophoron daubneyi TaxID=300641 RepID=A0AAV2TMZ0_CALDB
MKTRSMSKLLREENPGLSWIRDSHGHVPPNAVKVQNGVYVARIEYKGDIVPGKVVSKYKLGYIPYEGREVELSNYEVLCDTTEPGVDSRYKWVNGHDGLVPKNAIVGGIAVSTYILYIGRSNINGEEVVGKIHPVRGCAYFPWGGEEHKKKEYQVLVRRE